MISQADASGIPSWMQGERDDSSVDTKAWESSRAMVGEGGELRLPEAQRRRWGLEPGVEWVVRETPAGLLVRRADPPLGKVYVEPTSACNLSCRTCVRQSWDEPAGTMSMATYRRLVRGLRAIPTLRAVSFWGFGEPLLHPQIVEMVALAKRLGATTELITNGLLLDRKTAEGLVGAGLDRLVVSVDGTSAESYADVRVGGDLRRVAENIAALRAARRASARHNPEIGIEFVAMRRNVSELPRLRELAQSLGASFIVVTNVLPYSEELRDEILYPLWAARSYPTARSKWSPEIALPRLDARREGLAALVGLMQHNGALEFPAAWPGDTQGYCRFVGEGAAAVSWDGEVSPCVALMHTYPCYILGRKKLIRRYSLGNVRREAIGSIWAREEYVRFRDRVQRFDFAPCSDCGSCELAESNVEDCFGNPFPVCGDCLWAKGVIQCP